MAYIDDEKLTIIETNTFTHIPLHDYFKIEKQWIITQNETDTDSLTCNIKIYVHVIFLQYTILQSTIEWQTREEVADMAEKWYKKVTDYLILHPQVEAPLVSEAVLLLAEERGSSKNNATTEIVAG